MTPRKQPAAPLEASPASAWGGEPASKVHVLPGGLKMELRRAPAMRKLVMQGVVPSALLGVILVPAEDGKGYTTDFDVKLFEEQRAAVVCAMAVDPNVVLEPFDGAVEYDTLTDEQVGYIVAWAQEGLEGVARFLDEPGGDADGEGGEAVGEGAE